MPSAPVLEAVLGGCRILGRSPGLVLQLILLCLVLVPGIASSANYNAMWTQVSSSGAAGAPVWRAWSAMAWVNSDARIVLWGGSGAFFQNDVAAFDPVTASWATLEPATSCPGNTLFAPPNGSDESGVVFDAISNLLWISIAGSGYRCATEQAVGRTAEAGTTTTAIVDPTLSATTDDFYKDWTVRDANGAKASVVTYVAFTRTLTLSNSLNVAPGSSYDLYVDFGDGTWSYSFATGQYSKLQLKHWGYTGYVPASRKSPGFAGDGTKAILFGGP